MDRRPEAQELLDQLSETIGLGPGTFDDTGAALIRCTLPDGALDVHLQLNEEDETLSLATALLRLPPDDEESAELLQGLMAANLLGSGTNGLVFSWSPGSHEVLLGYTLLWPGANYETFETAFGRLLHDAVVWKKKLTRVGA